MRFLSMAVAVIAGLAGGTAAQADVRDDVAAITRFCLGYVETGTASDLLLRSGFGQKGRKLEKSYNQSAFLATQPVLSVKAGRNRQGLECSANIAILGRNDGEVLINTALQTARDLGYAQGTAMTARGKPTPALIRAGHPVGFGASLASRYSTHDASFFFQQLDSR
jgi:hypothetical protein